MRRSERLCGWRGYRMGKAKNCLGSVTGNIRMSLLRPWEGRQWTQFEKWFWRHWIWSGHSKTWMKYLLERREPMWALMTEETGLEVITLGRDWNNKTGIEKPFGGRIQELWAESVLKFLKHTSQFLTSWQTIRKNSKPKNLEILQRWHWTYTGNIFLKLFQRQTSNKQKSS